MARNLVLWLVIAVVLMMVFQNLSTTTVTNELDYSEFINEVRDGRIEKVEFQDAMIYGERQNGETFQTVRPNVSDPKLMDDLINNNVDVIGKPPQQTSFWMQLFLASFPILLIIGVFIFFMRQMQGGAGGRGGPMSFGKSKARLLGENQIKTTFSDVAGIDEAKEDLQELVQYLRDPAKFQKLGGEIPRGVLMVGPPGTGKTLMAKAIAGEAKVPFFTISGSDFVEMFVGVGASRVRDMFDQAKKQAPCIIFIDEIDAVGRHRGGGYGGGNDEREQTLNQLLVEMDGFEGNEGVIVIAATNRPDVLDKALLRPGRFDRRVHVDLPDIRGREQIIEVHIKRVPIDESVKSSVIARSTPGFSGADLANLVNEAALIAARRNKRVVDAEDFEFARDKITMGAERRSMVMSEKEKINTAYHEAGHAIVGYLSPEHHPIHKVTIIPRGRALGLTMYLPEEDKISDSRLFLKSRICTAFGGRIAEELIGGEDAVTTGAYSDIKFATQIARTMITKSGFSEGLGPIHYGEEEKDFGATPNFSDHTSKLIDEEVRQLVDECYDKAKNILEENIDILHAMKDALMEYETIDSEQVDDLMARKKVRPPAGWSNDSGDSGAGASEGESSSEEPKANKPEVGGPASQH